MKLCEITNSSNLREFLLFICRFAPGKFQERNGVYIARDPDNDDYDLRVSASATDNLVHVRYTHPNNSEGFQKTQDFHMWMLKLGPPTIRGLRQTSEKYENHPGLTTVTFAVDISRPYYQ